MWFCLCVFVFIIGGESTRLLCFARFVSERSCEKKFSLNVEDLCVLNFAHLISCCLCFGFFVEIFFFFLIERKSLPLKLRHRFAILINKSFLPFWYEKICFRYVTYDFIFFFLLLIWVFPLFYLQFKDGGVCSVSKLIFHTLSVSFHLCRTLCEGF